MQTIYLVLNAEKYIKFIIIFERTLNSLQAMQVISDIRNIENTRLWQSKRLKVSMLNVIF